MNWLIAHAQEPTLLDHVPIGTRTQCAYHDAIRRDKLRQAAERYGRPFKCAARGIAREVIVTPGTVGVKS